jgi:hypothetical protein
MKEIPKEFNSCVIRKSDIIVVPDIFVGTGPGWPPTCLTGMVKEHILSLYPDGNFNPQNLSEILSAVIAKLERDDTISKRLAEASLTEKTKIEDQVNGFNLIIEESKGLVKLKDCMVFLILN